MPTKLSNTFYFLWWLLWASALVLMEFHFRDFDGNRFKVPYGQYLFFAIAVFSTAVIIGSLKQQIVENINKPLAISLLGLFVSLTLSASLGLNPGYGLRLLIIIVITSGPFVLLGHNGVLLVNKNVMDPPFVLAVGCVVAACIFSLTGPVDLFGVTIENYLMGARWAFLFLEANGFAWVIAMGITILCFRICTSQALSAKLVYGLLVLPLMLVVFWKTNSRGSMLWVLVTLLCYSGLALQVMAVKLGDIDTRKIWMTALFVVTGLTLAILMIYGSEMMTFLRLNQHDLTTGRMQVWQFYFDYFTNNPLLGFGFGASDRVMADFEVSGQYQIAGPLNVFVGVLGESGLLGMVSLLLLWLGAVWKTWRVVKTRFARRDAVFHYAFLLMVMLISMAAQQNGEWQVLRVTPFNFLFFFLVSAAWTLENSEPPVADSPVPGLKH